MDYKGPPQQYGSPPPGQAYPPQAPPQGQPGAMPQYGNPQLQQQQPAYPQQPAQVAQYGAPHPQQQPPAAGGAPAQYQAQAPMQRSVGPVNSNEWNNSLMDCSPCDSCCLGTFLPCVLLGKTADRMRDPTMQTADSMNSDCLVFTAIQCFTGCGWIYVMMKRTEIRERFGIQGDGMGDCCASYWCPCCSLIQQDNEVKDRTQHLVAPNQGYQAQPGMVMPQK